MINFILNGKAAQANEGETILDVAKRHNIKIPTLCHLELDEIEYCNRPASCRVCMVELGNGRLVPSCSSKVTEGMAVNTETLKAIRARRSMVELLLSDHPNSCLTCAKNTRCDLQKLAHDLGVRSIKYQGETASHPIDDNSFSLVRDPNKCILCGKCETMCSEVQTVHTLTMVERGFDTYVGSSFNRPMKDTVCTFCGQCLTVCPTGALTEVDNTEKVWRALNSGQFVVVQTAPAVRVALGEEFDMRPGRDVTGKMVTALRTMGFDRVFDTNFAADLTIMEEGTEFMERLEKGGPFPLITSCCPAWVNFLESQFGDLIHLPSSAKSPHEMFGGVVKTYYAQKMGIDPKKITIVSVMPCVAKKYESKRPELGLAGEFQDVDLVITTRELGRMIREAGISFEQLEDGEFDDPLGESTGGAVIFGATGGVIEATLRTVNKLLTGETLIVPEFVELRGFKGIKTTTVNVAGHSLNIAVTNGLGNIRTLLNAIREGIDNFHAVEVMACPGGCIGGAGQPYHHGDLSLLTKRSEGLYAVDRGMKSRVSSDNLSVQKLYKEYFGKPGSKRAHDVLHTSYANRPKY
jgi:NADH-quinone oxidoreductase subunit G